MQDSVYALFILEKQMQPNLTDLAFTYFHWSSLDCIEGLSSLVFTHEGLNPVPHEHIKEMDDINFIFHSAQQQVYL